MRCNEMVIGVLRKFIFRIRIAPGLVEMKTRAQYQKTMVIICLFDWVVEGREKKREKIAVFTLNTESNLKRVRKTVMVCVMNKV